VSGGNTELEPETATTQTLGIVLSPAFEQEWLAQMQLGLDWYRIEVDDAIDNIDATTYIPACYDPVTNPGLAASGYWCGFLSRDGTTGQIVDIVDTLVNYSRREVSGVDLHLDWHIPAGPGTIGISALASWLDEFKLSPAHGLPPDERTGLVGGGVGGSQPEWKANIGLSYQWSAFTVGAQWRYIDAMHDADVNAGGWDYRVPSQDYSDLYLEGAFETGLFAGLTIRAGVENLSDEEPPLLPSAVAANTDPSQYDVLGRRYYLNFGYRF
jgi:outer membrane receptor protein involved in Fe transport